MPLDHELARLDRLINWERRDRAGMRRRLDPVLDLVRRLGSPHERWRAVHVAGTKGKGTTAALIAAGLSKAGLSTGLSTGLYTSPHVDRMQERVRIDGRDVADERLATALARALDAREAAIAEGAPGAEATWFDVLTAASFAAFAEEGVAWVVVECGLGGRLDSTNVVRGEVCVVTNVDLEHTAVLGGTRAEIAAEKAGIVKPGSRVVTGIPAGGGDLSDPGEVLDGVARKLGVPVVRPSATAATMLGRNVDLARLALDQLGEIGVRGPGGSPIGGSLLDPGTIAAAKLPGRMDRFRIGDTWIAVDGAHVPSSVRMVLTELRGRPELSGRPVVVLALGRDKDAEGILKALGEHADTVVCTSLPNGPLRGAPDLARLASDTGLAAEAEDDPAAALRRAVDRARGKSWVLVIGSLYLAGAARAALPTAAEVGVELRC